MDDPLFDAVAAFLDARLDDERANPTGRYVSRAEAFKDIEAKVRIMNRAYEARDLARSFPDDPGTRVTLATYGAVLRHLAEVYNAPSRLPARLVARRRVKPAPTPPTPSQT